VVGKDGTVWFVTHTELVALTPAGKLKWRVELDDSIWHPFAVTTDGITIVQDNTDTDAFDPDGKKLWTAPLRCDSPVVLTQDGLALFNYSTGSGSRVHVLDVTSPAGSPWPMFGHDATRSGQYTDGNGSAPW
jgi:hypothetical protein